MCDTPTQSGKVEDLEGTMDEVMSPPKLQVNQVVLLEADGETFEPLLAAIREAVRWRCKVVAYQHNKVSDRLRKQVLKEIKGMVGSSVVVCGESEFCNPTVARGMAFMEDLNGRQDVDVLIFQEAPPEMARIFDETRLKNMWRVLRSSHEDMYDRAVRELNYALRERCEFAEPAPQGWLTRVLGKLKFWRSLSSLAG